MTRVDIRPRCPHGRPTNEHCADCSPPAERPVERSLVDILSEVTIPLGPEPLHLPPVYGRHEARVSKAKGKWTVTCCCGAFRASGDERRRHFLESAWGAHRNELS